jgi:hypothetical protein
VTHVGSHPIPIKFVFVFLFPALLCPALPCPALLDESAFFESREAPGLPGPWYDLWSTPLPNRRGTRHATRPVPTAQQTTGPAHLLCCVVYEPSESSRVHYYETTTTVRTLPATLF